MKKLLLAVSALLVLTQNAQATTVKSALAQYTTSPLSALKRPGISRGNKQQVVIYTDGLVYGYVCKTNPADKFKHTLPMPCPSYKLDTLTKQEIRNLEALVEAAREGEVKNDGPQLCEAIPNRSFNYTADNESITLRTGTGPCGGSDTNRAPEAKELIDVLNGYMNELHTKIGGFAG